MDDSFAKADLVLHFDLPIKAAAALLGVSLTQLKRICRLHGIPRWPYRKLQSVRGRINEKKIILERANDAKHQIIAEEITVLESKIAKIKEDPSCIMSKDELSDEDEDSSPRKRKAMEYVFEQPDLKKFKAAKKERTIESKHRTSLTQSNVDVTLIRQQQWMLQQKQQTLQRQILLTESILLSVNTCEYKLVQYPRTSPAQQYFAVPSSQTKLTSVRKNIGSASHQFCPLVRSQPLHVCK
jgi:hypothetical protein